jgi:hypothetical protein
MVSSNFSSEHAYSNLATVSWAGVAFFQEQKLKSICKKIPDFTRFRQLHKIASSVCNRFDIEQTARYQRICHVSYQFALVKMDVQSATELGFFEWPIAIDQIDLQ